MLFQFETLITIIALILATVIVTLVIYIVVALVESKVGTTCLFHGFGGRGAQYSLDGADRTLP